MKEEDPPNPYAAPPMGKHIPLWRRLVHASRRAAAAYREGVRHDNMGIGEQVMGCAALVALLLLAATFALVGLMSWI